MKKWLLAASLCSGMAFADVAVIVNPSNGDALDKDTISRLFLNKAKAFSNGTKVAPFALAEGNATTDEFNGKVLNKTAAQLTAFWSKLVFTGKGQPPKALSSDAEVIITLPRVKCELGLLVILSVALTERVQNEQ